MLEMKTDTILATKNFRVRVIDLTKMAMNKFDAMFSVIKTLNKKTILGLPEPKKPEGKGRGGRGRGKRKSKEEKNEVVKEEER